VDRIKRLSFEVLEKNRARFGENFTDNKKLLDELAIVRSKGLKNEVAGYITRFIKKENREQEIKQSKIDSSNEESATTEETVEIETVPAEESEEEIIEVGADTTNVPETNETSEEKTE